MQVDVEYRLTGFPVCIEDRPEAADREPLVFGERSGAPNHLTHELIIAWRQVVQRCDMPLRYDQKVYRGLRIDVIESKDALVFVHDGCRDLAVDDLAEEAVGRVDPLDSARDSGARNALQIAAKVHHCEAPCTRDQLGYLSVLPEADLEDERRAGAQA